MTDLEIKLIPDGAAQMPVEARDHGILANDLEAAGPPSNSPAPSWDEIERVVRGDGSVVILRIPDATLDDYNSNALDAFANAIANKSGVKKHPDGWVEVE